MSLLPESEPKRDCERKQDWIILGIAMAVAAILLALQHNRFLTVVNHDAAIFCILAQSLLKGHYMLVSEPNPQPYFTFPPFMSVQLAGLMLLFNNTDIQAMQGVFKSYINLLFLASIPLYYWWSKGLLGQRHAAVLTVLLAVNPIIYKYIADVLSDAPFWTFSMAAVFCVWRRQKSMAANDGKATRWSVASIVLVILCALTRQIGVALVLGYLIMLGLEKRWKQLVIAGLCFALTVGGWQSYEHFYRSAHRSDIASLNQQGVQEVLDKSPIKLEYVKHFLVDRPVDMDENRSQADPMVLAGNAVARFFGYTHLMLDELVPPLEVRLGSEEHKVFHWPPFMILLWAGFFYGLWRLWQAFRFGAIYLALYFGVLLVYPYISVRFLLPVFPLALVCVYWGALDLVRYLRSEKFASKPMLQKAALGILPVFLVLALTSHLIETIRRVHDGYELKVANVGPSLREGNRAYYETLLWMKDHIPTGAIVISRKPPVTYFYSGHVSTAFPFTDHADKLFAYIADKQKLNPDEPLYIFEDTVFDNSNHLTAAVERHQDSLKLIYTEPKTHSRIWQLSKLNHTVYCLNQVQDYEYKKQQKEISKVLIDLHLKHPDPSLSSEPIYPKYHCP